nr:patatin-like protein [Pseudomonadota bacterium]
VETEHRLVASYSDHGIARDTLADRAELTFAARATSSFPGAFPPFTIAELDGVLAERGLAWPGRADFLERVLPRQWAANATESAVLIDGSVLANAPFKPAMDALRERPARRQIDRRFVYIDPHPGFKIQFGDTSKPAPGFFQTIIGAVSELPRQQPIRDNLDAIAEKSRGIERMRTIIAGIRPEIEKRIDRLFGRTLFLDSPTTSRLAKWRARAQAAAASDAGYGYAAYGHLKLAGVVEAMANLLYHAGEEPGPQRWEKVRGHILDAVRARGLDEMEASFASGASKATIDFLRTFDLGFRIRRLRLLARRVSALEQDHDAADLDPIRDAIYASLADYLECKRTERHAHLKKEVRLLRGDAGPLLDRLGESLSLKALDTMTDERFAAALDGLPRDIKRAILLTYLGFPYSDVATLPLLQGEGLDEYDPIKVDRISPDDARSIREGGAEATLKGIQFNTFGAFFSRAYRENDYLWGRLHGAERMIDIVVSTLDGPKHLKPGRVAAIKRAAFLAILDEEEPKLTTVAALIESLRREIG